MVRHNKRKGTTMKWTEQDLADAIEHVKQHKNVMAASKLYKRLHFGAKLNVTILVWHQVILQCKQPHKRKRLFKHAYCLLNGDLV